MAKKNHLAGPPPFQLMDMIITVIYGVPDQERQYPYFTKKSWLFASGVAGPHVEGGEEVQIYAL